MAETRENSDQTSVSGDAIAESRVSDKHGASTDTGAADSAAEHDPRPRNGENGDAKSKHAPPWMKPLVLGLGAVALLAALLFGGRYWIWSRSHVSTDDAYVTGNLVNVGPLISGTLVDLTVQEGDIVKRGQVIARLDPAGPVASLRQAEANYRTALTQIPQAQRNLTYQEQQTRAAIRRAQADLAAQRARTTGAGAQVTLTSATVRNQTDQARGQLDAADAQWRQALAIARAAEAGVENFRQAVETAQAALANYEHQVDTANRAADAAEARVIAAAAAAARSEQDAARYQQLFDDNAISAQLNDQARAQATSDHAQLAAARAEADQARSQVEQARSGVDQARSQVVQARKSVVQAEAQYQAANRAADAYREQVGVAVAGLKLARANAAQVPIQQANLLSTAGEARAAEADVETAESQRQQVVVRRRQVETTRSQSEQAFAELTNARIIVDDTVIYAPMDGMVVRKTANVGASLSPGQTILTITEGSIVWVTANFKETQLTGVRPGQAAEVEVDAFPGKVFKGRLQSINEATGAATSLLPPDNATGNFTKIVQRVPVRIDLFPAGDREDRKYARSADIRNLRQGMSVTATIDTNSKPARTAGESGAVNAGGGSPGAMGAGTGAPVSQGGSVSTGAPNGTAVGQESAGQAQPNTGAAASGGPASPGPGPVSPGAATPGVSGAGPPGSQGPAPPGAISVPNVPNPGAGQLGAPIPAPPNVGGPGDLSNNGPGFGGAPTAPSRAPSATPPPNGTSTPTGQGTTPATGQTPIAPYQPSVRPTVPSPAPVIPSPPGVPAPPANPTAPSGIGSPGTSP